MFKAQGWGPANQRAITEVFLVPFKITKLSLGSRSHRCSTQAKRWATLHWDSGNIIDRQRLKEANRISASKMFKLLAQQQIGWPNSHLLAQAATQEKSPTSLVVESLITFIRPTRAPMRMGAQSIRLMLWKWETMQATSDITTSSTTSVRLSIDKHHINEATRRLINNISSSGCSIRTKTSQKSHSFRSVPQYREGRTVQQTVVTSIQRTDLSCPTFEKSPQITTNHL